MATSSATKTGTVDSPTRLDARCRERLQSIADAFINRAPSGLAKFIAFRQQAIRRVPIRFPMLGAILQGHKELYLQGRIERLEVGDLFVLPGAMELDVTNVPDPCSGAYLSLAVDFPPQLIGQFKQLFPEACAPIQPKVGQVRVSARPGLALALSHLVECLAASPPPSPAQTTVYQLSILLRLVEECDCHTPLLPLSASPVDHLRALLDLSPGHDWSLAEAADRLSLSEATLRRRLSQAGVRFRTLLEEARLARALALLQSTPQPIGEISAACGYESPSRFAARFRRRFGLPPSRFR